MIPVKNTHPLPKQGEPGAFGAIRKFDIHTGIDIYCNRFDPVHAIEDGVIVAVEKFTGEHADSPWWNNTWALLIEGQSGVIVYGEIEPIKEFWVGETVRKGDRIGKVIPVLKVDKGVTPINMLHFELHKPGTTASVWWKHGEDQPHTLLNPTEFLDEIYRT